MGQMCTENPPGKFVAKVHTKVLDKFLQVAVAAILHVIVWKKQIEWPIGWDEPLYHNMWELRAWIEVLQEARPNGRETSREAEVSELSLSLSDDLEVVGRVGAGLRELEHTQAPGTELL